MRRIEGRLVANEEFGIELTESELRVLLEKLDMPDSSRALTHFNTDGSFWVRVVPDEAHGEDALVEYMDSKGQMRSTEESNWENEGGK